MEREMFLSGYCRVLDQSRIVAVELDGKRLLDVDCCYGSCVHQPNCAIAAQISELIKAE